MNRGNEQRKQTKQTKIPEAPPLTDTEIEESMAELGGFIDITPEDFRRVYRKAYEKAMARREPGGLAQDKTEQPSKRTGQKTEAQPKAAQSAKNVWLQFLRPVSEPAPRVSWLELFWSWLGALIGIGLVAYLHYGRLGPGGTTMLVGSFGATAVLIYGAIRSPLAQPRNLVGGHLISAAIGVASWQAFEATPWFAAAFAVATAIGVMHYTRTLHPPGGATALIAVIGGDKIHALGYGYLFSPIFTGVMIMLAVSLLLNNVVKWRRYPEFWI